MSPPASELPASSPPPEVPQSASAPRPERRRLAGALAFVGAAGCHAVVLFALQGSFVQGPEFDVIAGDTTIEVALVAAAPAAEEVLAEPPPEPTAVPPPFEAIPEPMPIPPPEAMVEPAPPPPEPPPVIPPKPQPPKPKPAVERKPAPRRPAVANAPVGDGSSPTPGLDATTARAGSPGDRAKPGYLRNPHPTYPDEARRAGQQGTVQIRVRVNASGGIASASLIRSSGFALLDERALSTVRGRWSFKPARVGGVAIASEVIVPIRFSLQH